MSKLGDIIRLPIYYYMLITGNHTMKRNPKEGDEVHIMDYETSVKGTWVLAVVETPLSAQFTYRTALHGRHGFMMYNSTDWEYPNEKVNRSEVPTDSGTPGNEVH